MGFAFIYFRDVNTPQLRKALLEGVAISRGDPACHVPVFFGTQDGNRDVFR